MSAPPPPPPPPTGGPVPPPPPAMSSTSAATPAPRPAGDPGRSALLQSIQSGKKLKKTKAKMKDASAPAVGGSSSNSGGGSRAPAQSGPMGGLGGLFAGGMPMKPSDARKANAGKKTFAAAHTPSTKPVVSKLQPKPAISASVSPAAVSTARVPAPAPPPPPNQGVGAGPPAPPPPGPPPPPAMSSTSAATQAPRPAGDPGRSALLQSIQSGKKLKKTKAKMKDASAPMVDSSASGGSASNAGASSSSSTANSGDAGGLFGPGGVAGARSRLKGTSKTKTKTKTNKVSNVSDKGPDQGTGTGTGLFGGLKSRLKETKDKVKPPASGASAASSGGKSQLRERETKAKKPEVASAASTTTSVFSGVNLRSTPATTAKTNDKKHVTRTATAQRKVNGISGPDVTISVSLTGAEGKILHRKREEWTITTQGQGYEWSVSRKPSDIVWLFDQILKHYPGIIIPMPPHSHLSLREKLATKSHDDRLLLTEQLLLLISTHPVMRKDPIFKYFLQETAFKKSADIKVLSSSELSSLRAGVIPRNENDVLKAAQSLKQTLSDTSTKTIELVAALDRLRLLEENKAAQFSSLSDGLGGLGGHMSDFCLIQDETCVADLETSKVCVHGGVDVMNMKTTQETFCNSILEAIYDVKLASCFIEGANASINRVMDLVAARDKAIAKVKTLQESGGASASASASIEKAKQEESVLIMDVSNAVMNLHCDMDWFEDKRSQLLEGALKVWVKSEIELKSSLLRQFQKLAM